MPAQMTSADRHDVFGAFVAIWQDPPAAGQGALRGARLAVKDNIAVAGLPWTAGHPMFARRIATQDAEAVVRLRDAGAQVVGVTQTDAGGFGVTTPSVINPARPGRTAGGSSGGSAAAVAAGLADIGLGTDTGGSVRIPAACCGLYAFKPSFGRVPLDGVWPMAPQLDHVGLMTRDFELLRTAAAVLLQSRVSGEGRAPRFGVDLGQLERLDPPIARSFLQAVERIRALGLEVIPVQLPDAKTVSQVHAALALGQAREVYAGLWPLDASQLGGHAHRALCAAQAVDEAATERATLASSRIARSLDEVFSRVDAVLAPTLPVDIPAAGARSVIVNGHKTPVVSALTSQTCIANVTGCTAAVLPLTSDALHGGVSIQLLAAPGHDESLFAHCMHLQPLCGPAGMHVAS